MNFRERYQYNPATDLLGKGGFSSVYKAYDKLLDRTVALKFFKSQENNKYDVISEIRKVIQLDHPNITRYYDVAELQQTTIHGEVEKMQVGIMEYINSGDIKTYLATDSTHFKSLVKDLMKGIEHLHNQGIIHRDIKPSNVLIQVKDGKPSVKICDFGISKSTDNTQTTASGLEEEVKRRGMFNVIDHRTGYKIDFMVKKFDEYRENEFQRRIRDESLGFPAWFVSVEDLILSKLIWIQEYQSDKQKEDILNLLNNETVNIQYIKKWCYNLDLQTFNLI